jgi:hypothetical protein
MRRPAPLPSGHFVALALVAMVLNVMSPAAQSQTQKPPARPSTAKPAAPQTKPAPATPAPEKPAAPEPVKAPAPPPPQDVRYKAVYSTGGMKTESLTYVKGERERFEFQEMVLLRQHDQKRTIQISKSANTYLVSPEGAPPTPIMPGLPAPAPKPEGVIVMTTTIVDTGERKSAFGLQARHVKTMVDKQPMAGACDTSRQRIETDGWYIDAPAALAKQTIGPEQPAPPGACADQIRATSNGDPKVLGFPIAYTTTITGEDGKPVVASMEITEFEQTTLDAPLFEIPPGLNAAMNVRDMSKALSDANEMKLAEFNSDPPVTPLPKTPGVVRVGVPEFTNQTTQAVDTRALRHRLIGELNEAKIEAMPMAAGAPAELQRRAKELGYDYLLLAEVTELKVSKPGAFGGLMMKAASGVAAGRGGAAGAAAGAAGAAAGAAGAAAGAVGAATGAAGAAAAPKENTESSIAVKLLQADGKQRLSTTAKGKDGTGFSLQTGLGLTKFAGGMYLSMFAGPQMFARLNAFGASNLGGMGMLGNPTLYQMQAGNLYELSKGAGIDTTAVAASYLISQAITMNSLGGLVGAPGQGPSYDESLGEAVQSAAKAVQKAIQK